MAFKNGPKNYLKIGYKNIHPKCPTKRTPSDSVGWKEILHPMHSLSNTDTGLAWPVDASDTWTDVANGFIKHQILFL